MTYDTGKGAPGKEGGQHPRCLETYKLSGGGIWEIYRPRKCHRKGAVLQQL